MELKSIPTGISSLDLIIEGGFPSGSFTLLLGEVGAGSTEFAYSSAIMLSLIKEGVISAPSNEDITIPESICYVSITRSEEDVLREVFESFTPEYYEAFKENMVFMDFSEEYFRRSPFLFTDGTYSFNSLKGLGKEKGIVESLVTFLNENAENSLVIIDSLTDLVRMYTDLMKWQDLILFLKGFQKASKNWNGLTYALLTTDIFEVSKQVEIADCADGVLVFEWGEIGTAQRQRTMYVKKFRGLLPRLEFGNIAKFETKITKNTGFEVSNVKMIMGRR